MTVESGAYRFPNVPIGVYSLTFEISGFQRVIRENVRIATGFAAEINAKLEVSSVQETVTVSAASPVVDTRSTIQGQTFTREMLESIPTARDPWVVLEQTPGVIMNQQNVGGNKSGQQSTFIAHGTGNNEVWNVDGGNITDMAASSSSLYFDFDAFEEIQIQTGGSDASVQSSGVSINLVTRSGGNTLRGSSRFYVVDNNFQGDNINAELEAQGAGFGNPVKNIKDYGFELGGPIVRNKAWFWGSAGFNDIQVGVIGFTNPGGDPNDPDDLFTDLTKLKTYNAKLQYQWAPSNKSTFLYFFNDKIRNARGASPTSPPETTFRQAAPVSNFKASHQWIREQPADDGVPGLCDAERRLQAEVPRGRARVGPGGDRHVHRQQLAVEPVQRQPAAAGRAARRRQLLPVERARRRSRHQVRRRLSRHPVRILERSRRRGDGALHQRSGSHRRAGATHADRGHALSQQQHRDGAVADLRLHPGLVHAAAASPSTAACASTTRTTRRSTRACRPTR